eukprot:4926186-Pleurochrysis_carterae.AAC.1
MLSRSWQVERLLDCRIPKSALAARKKKARAAAERERQLLEEAGEAEPEIAAEADAAAEPMEWLTKWKTLGYDECTWESEATVGEAAVRAFRKREAELAAEAEEEARYADSDGG